MRILIYSPTLRHFGLAILSQLKAVRALDDRPHTLVDHLRGYGRPGSDPRNGKQIVLAKYRDARYHFLAGDYDTFISLEDDMILPEDALCDLVDAIDAGADIAYGVYCWRHTSSGHRWSAYTEVTETTGASVSQEPELAKNLFNSRSAYRVRGVGLGITAMRRRVLDSINFERRGGGDCDWYFAMDAATYGFSQLALFSVICGHMTLEPSPRILWPDPDAEHLVRMEYLEPESHGAH